jgi:hypothetical protein
MDCYEQKSLDEYEQEIRDLISELNDFYWDTIGHDENKMKKIIKQLKNIRKLL